MRGTMLKQELVEATILVLILVAGLVVLLGTSRIVGVDFYLYIVTNWQSF